ncbi:MAG: hypothetical protein JNM10_15510 [Planctomycetia bacterium]|nr:hypothetical protein [Planctomycetia bacterium]
MEAPPRGTGVVRLRTEHDGTLALPGGEDEEFQVQPVELDWIVAVPRVGVGATVTVVPAFALSVRVVADADGAALATFEASATAQGSQRAFRATDGGFVVQWPRNGAEALDAVVTAAAPGFLPATRDVRIVASMPVERVELRLVRAPRPGAVEVTVVGAPAGLLERGFDVELREPTKPRSPVARREVPAAVGGVFRFELEPGTWRISLRPRDASLAVVACTADVVVGSERTTDVSWRVPPCGSIRFEWKATGPFGRWVLRPEDGGTATSLDVPDGPPEHRHVPAGSYRMMFDGPGECPAIPLVVKDGETTVVELK